MSRKPGERPIGLAVFGGFVLGAATVLLVVWAYGARWRGDSQATGTAGTAATAATAPVPSIPYPAPTAPTPVPSMPPSNPPTTAPLPVPSPAAPASPVPLPPVSPGSATVPAAPAPSTTSARQPDTAETADLTRRQLLLPVQGVRPEALQDTFVDARGGGARQHEALDILAPRNTPILAVEDGKVVKLFLSKLGGLTIYQFDPTTTYTYYYAHLERYADGLKEGDPVRRGQVLGYVGTSGDAPADAPHLHFAIMRLTPEKHWWQGTALDPYPILRQSGTAPTR
jgi:murein DD-endopeptidase MepM/ murein hydrolase activator NlpD